MRYELAADSVPVRLTQAVSFTKKLAEHLQILLSLFMKALNTTEVQNIKVARECDMIHD